MDRLLTAEEVADLLRQPINTLAYWRHCRKGPRFARIGARVYYRERDVHAWVAEQFEAAER